MRTVRLTEALPGDQTGTEASTQAWYLSSKGWRVFCAKNPGVAEKITQAM